MFFKYTGTQRNRQSTVLLSLYLHKDKNIEVCLLLLPCRMNMVSNCLLNSFKPILQLLGLIRELLLAVDSG